MSDRKREEEEKGDKEMEGRGRGTRGREHYLLERYSFQQSTLAGPRWAFAIF